MQKKKIGGWMLKLEDEKTAALHNANSSLVTLHQLAEVIPIGEV